MQFYYPSELPISSHKDIICSTIREHQVVIIAGDTGSGKTTQLPKMCMEAGLGSENRKIGCTQPRRIAAISVSQRVSHELQRSELVGYKIRFQDTLSGSSIIKFMTDGILLAETRQDRLLHQYDAIIIDEAHERSLNIDFLLGYLKKLTARRNDLKVIISSATIDVEKFSRHFADAPIISVSGRLHPIQTIYTDEDSQDSSGNYVELAVTVIQDLCTDPFGGDILVFMPTERDIFETIDGLNEYIQDNNLVLPLFGRMQAKDQQRIFRSSRKRKIIIATNVAETSITVPGIRFVIDTGLARISKYSPGTGTTNLKISKVSQASCNQRMGRCGRTGPGTCIRLYTEQDYQSRDQFSLPEVQRANLAEVILQMISLNLGKVEEFPFLDKPHPRAVREGFRTLRELNALTAENKLTKRGRLISHLPLDPRISAIILEGQKHGALQEITIIAAALSIQDPRVRPIEHENKADEAHKIFIDKNSDFMTLLQIWNCLFADQEKVSWSRLGKFCKQYYLSWQRMREWIDVHEQINRILKKNKSFKANTTTPQYKDIHIPLTYGFLRNIGRKKEKNLYQSGNGRELRLFPGSSIYNKGAEWIVSSSQVETSQLFARTAANIEVEWLEDLGGSLCKKSWSNPRWDKKRGQVIADEQVTLFGMPIVTHRKVNYGRINKKCRQEARELFIRQALMENRLGGNYPFLRKNKKLLMQYLEMEDRMRRKDIIVDDEQIFSFYDQRIENAYDRFTLNRLLKHKKNDHFLLMQADDICLTPDAQNELYLFPPSLRAGDQTVPLSYLFEPGNEKDGVTALINQEIVPMLQPALFEWLVPGLLSEKLLLLFKRLPKRLRKQLVPLPQAVDKVLDMLQLYEGSLYQNVEKAVIRGFQVSIQRKDWCIDELPPHLIMRYELLDKNNKTILATRSFSELLAFRQPHEYSPSSDKGGHTLPEKKNLNYTDLDAVKESVSFRSSGGSIEIFYPGFAINQIKNEVSLTYTKDQKESIQTTTQVVEFFYTQFFKNDVKQLKKECKRFITDNSASFLSIGGNFSSNRLKNEVFSFVMRSLFGYEPGLLVSASCMTKKVEQVKAQGFIKLSQNMLKVLSASLQARKKTRQDIETWAQRAKKNKSFTSQRYTEYKNNLAQILPQNFITEIQAEDITNTCRYLKALSIRIERAEHSPLKDTNKAKQLTQPLELLEQTKQFTILTSDCRKKIEEYRQLVEEFRVATFAPELGTQQKVSSKKLRLLWQEVESSCRMVE